METFVGRILFLTDLLIPADGQIKVDIFRHTNFAIWSMGTEVMPVLLKNERFCHICAQISKTEDFSEIFH